jgi:excisionase family DNA binding protein
MKRSDQSTATPNDEITTPTAAALLGLTIPHTQKLFRDGAIPARKVERGWVTSRQAVEQYRRVLADRRAAQIGSGD